MFEFQIFNKIFTMGNTIILFQLLALLFFRNPIPQDYLQEGLTLEKEGKYEEALSAWARGFVNLEQPSFHIAQNYIRVATEREIEAAYETATDIYLWGLKAELEGNEYKALENEVEILAYIMDEELSKELKVLLQSKSPYLSERITQFWQFLDPTPSSIHNERLIEHWKRIAFIREEFKMGAKPPLETDIRGYTFLKYGPPDRVKAGILEATASEVESVCIIMGDQTPACNPTLMGEVIVANSPSPRYEFWVYYQPVGMGDQNLVIKFGESALGGFTKLKNVEEMIPQNLFTLSNRFDKFTLAGGGGRIQAGRTLSPGMVLQYIYYQKLATVDKSIAQRFTEFNTSWSGGNSSPSLGNLEKLKSDKLAVELASISPKEISTAENEFPTIPINAYYYRMLDEQNQPYVYTFVESNPLEIFLNDVAVNQDVMFESDGGDDENLLGYYDYKHGIQIFDKEGKRLVNTTQPVPLVVDTEENTLSSNVFRLKQSDQFGNIILYAELNNLFPKSSPRAPSIFPNSLRGMGKIETQLPEEIVYNEDELLMSDIVFGYQYREEVQEDALFPFVVLNEKIIKKNEVIALYFEIYNLKADAQGDYFSTVEYEISPVRNLEWIRGRDILTDLKLNQQSSESRFIQNLEIVTQEFKEGDYRLIITITDEVSEEVIEQEIRFTVE